MNLRFLEDFIEQIPKSGMELSKFAETIKDSLSKYAQKSKIDDFINLLKDVYTGAYTDMDKSNLVLTLAAIAYIFALDSKKFISPGFKRLSDIFLIAFIINNINKELTKYQEYKKDIHYIVNDMGVISFNKKEFDQE